MMDNRTHRMNITAKGFAIRWGTATLGAEGLINICVGSVTATPIQTFLIHQLVLGRSEGTQSDVDINLTPYGAAQRGVSRRHACLEKVAKRVMLLDLESTNGTFLNGQRIFPTQRRVVRDGDEIRLGQLVIYIFYEEPHDSKVEASTYFGINRFGQDEA